MKRASVGLGGAKSAAVASGAAVALAASTAWAAGDGEAGFFTVIAHAINLGLLLAIVVYFAGKKIRRALAERADAIGRDVETATRIRSEAQALLDDFEQKVAGLEEERARILSDARRDAEAERARLIAAAEADAARILRDAQRLVSVEEAHARQRIEREVIERALTAAEALVREKITPADQRRLTTEYVTRLEETASA